MVIWKGFKIFMSNQLATVDAIISLRSLAKIYEGDVRALAGVDIDIYRGEAVSIMGKSGSGKSTLLSLLGCLDVPTSGSYFFNNENVSEYSDRRLSAFRNLHIGFVFQSFYLIPQLNVIENVEVPLFYRRIPRRKRRSISLKYIEKVGLKDRAFHTPDKLSGGQRQRVAIARSLVNEPHLLLADEPTGSLDTNTGEDVMNILRSLNRDMNMTLIMVTHDEKIGKSLDRAIEISDGLVIRDEQCSI